MKRRKIDLSVERRIVTGMVVSDGFLRDVQGLYREGLFQAPACDLVARWCMDYVGRYDCAPVDEIEPVFQAWKKTDPDPDMVDEVEDFLGNLSEEYERASKINIPYLIDQAEEYFKERSLGQLSEEIQGALSMGDMEGAERALTDYHHVERLTSPGIDPFQATEEKIRAVFDNTTDPLFKLPGALGEMMNDQLVRSGFIGFMGPEKRGKTWRLLDLAIAAHRQRCNVAFFSVGDMDEDQMIRRQMIYLARKSDRPKYCGELLIPVLDCLNNQEDKCDRADRLCSFGVMIGDERMDFDEASDLNYTPCAQCARNNPRDFRGTAWYEKRRPVRPLEWREALDHIEAYNKRNKPKHFKLSTHPSKTMNVKGIRAHLDAWERVEGFVPDVVLVDYADILAPEDTRVEFRHQVNESWAALRSLSQERHCLVVTATQADAEAYGKDSLDQSNFSEDKRKYAHVTGMYALNQTVEEKRRGLIRIGELMVREDDFDLSQNVSVLQCLQIGRPYLASFRTPRKPFKT